MGAARRPGRAGEAPEAAARRELLEETGLRVAGALALFWHGVRPSSHRAGAFTEWHVYCARTAAQPVAGAAAAGFLPPPQPATNASAAPEASSSLRVTSMHDNYHRANG